MLTLSLPVTPAMHQWCPMPPTQWEQPDPPNRTELLLCLLTPLEWLLATVVMGCHLEGTLGMIFVPSED